MRILLFLIPLFLFESINAQQRQIDSLIKLSSQATQDSLKLKYYQEICVICETKDNLKYGQICTTLAGKLIANAPTKSEREKYIRKKIDAYNVIGIYYEDLELIDSVEKNNKTRLELARQTNNISLINEQLENLAGFYSRENLYTKIMNLYTDELKKAEKENNKEQIIFTLIGIRETYGQMRNHKKSLEYSLKVLELEKSNVKDSSKVAYAYFNVGQKYYNLFDYEKAVFYYLKSYSILGKKINNRDKSFYLFHLARAYNEQKNITESRNYLLKALDIVNEMGDSVIIGVVYSEIGQTYFYETNFDRALEYKLKGISFINGKSDGDAFLPYLSTGQIYLKIKQYKLAEQYVLKAKKIAEDRSLIHNQRAVMRVLADIYIGNGDVAKSNAYLVKYYQLNDSINKLKNTEELLFKELNYENEKNETQLKAEQEKQNALHSEEKKKQSVILYSVLGVLFLLSILAITIFKNLRKTREANRIIALQKSEVEEQKHLVDEKQKEIVDSITYAKRLQQAILPPQEFFDKHIPNNFILYKPKDIVAGDFYWAEKVDNLFFIAAADSTGHGVPGALVSVVCSNALNRTIKEFKLTDTGKILDKTRELVLETFEKSASEVKDGMDISLLCIDSKNKNGYWSGANNPLWYIQDSELKEIKADKQPIGKSDYPKPFTTHQIEYKADTTFYLFTDGFADQFGGPNGKKFKYKQFSDLLIKNNNLSQSQQADIINKAFTDWKGDLEQVDDVCIIGIKL